MTDWKRPDQGDSELSAPADPADDAADAAASDDDSGDGDAADGVEAGAVADADAVVRTRTRVGPDNLLLLVGAILVLAIVQVVFSWLVFRTTTEVRDQSAVANGLQRCLIQAQLNANTTTDPSGTVYKAAVQSCLNK